jgi:Fuc2NAc and GlcNAc transferase
MIVVIATGVLSVLLCGLFLRLARRWQFVDTPNERSSHTRPTPHGGGAALLVAFTLGLLLAAWHYGPWQSAFILLAIAAMLLMALGIVDDMNGLSVGFRLLIYALLCLLIAATFLRPLAATAFILWPLALLSALAMLWFINLYNFMDGIDGIAAIQSVIACGGAALLSWWAGGEQQYVLFCVLLAAVHCGFLIWNWPPARLFMGDAGSVPTGFLLEGLALLGGVQGQLNPLCWLILLAVFITDASWTLVWRIVTGQPFTQPHRLHAYQRLHRHWGSPLKIDFLLLTINLVWLFPIAWLAQVRPEMGLISVIVAYLPLLLGMAKMRHLP